MEFILFLLLFFYFLLCFCSSIQSTAKGNCDPKAELAKIEEKHNFLQRRYNDDWVTSDIPKDWFKFSLQNHFPFNNNKAASFIMLYFFQNKHFFLSGLSSGWSSLTFLRCTKISGLEEIVVLLSILNPTIMW